MNDFVKKGGSLFCWHMHGYRHMNYEVQGKNQEFGPIRSSIAVQNDISRGHQTLQSILKGKFTPVFTPPWNRCGAITLQALKSLGYAAVSRSRRSKPLSPGGLPDFFVNLDLHTRKEREPAAGWHNLFLEFEQAIASGFCGIMIHHQLMNAAAFEFLEVLFKALINHPKIQVVNFKDLVGQKDFLTDFTANQGQ